MRTTATRGNSKSDGWLAIRGAGGEDDDCRDSAHAARLGRRPLAVRIHAPYVRKRNVLLGLVVVRSLQLAALAWVTGYIVSGPIAGHSLRGLAGGVTAYVMLAAWTNLFFHFRQRLALELGECVVHDLRDALFVHLQRMTPSFFNRTKLGSIISRMTSDTEAVAPVCRTWFLPAWSGWGRCWWPPG